MFLCFHSLQTGKSFRTPILPGTKLGHPKFPFPSNGKVLSDEQSNPIASISFCFHSLQTGKSFRTWEDMGPYERRDYMFPFPSNGKVLSDLDWYSITNSVLGAHVSIPFKRESPFGLLSGTQYYAGSKFPFPSNGKVLSDSTQSTPPIGRFDICFHSLQTGKSFRTRTPYACRR